MLVPVWTALVWIVHALLVGIEWCYTLDLLNGATLGSVASALRAVQATLTEPLIAFALAAASVLALYHGIVRRRVAQTLAEVLVMLAMMAGGLWVVLDPVGTIGTLGHWADQTSLGVLAAVTAGEPASGDGEPRQRDRRAVHERRRGAVVLPRVRRRRLVPRRRPARPAPALRGAGDRIAGARLTDSVAAHERRAARARRDERGSVPGAAGQRPPAKLDQRHGFAAARALRLERRDELRRADGVRSRVPDRGWHARPGRRPAARRGRSRAA